jgi:hypothetical protein
MSSIFSEKPGAKERHLKRKFNNPLFVNQLINPMDIQDARQKDAEEVDQFMNSFRDLVQKAVELDANAEADIVLKLKEQLDKSYEQCSGLAGDQSEIKEMLKRLLKLIMQSMWKGIGNDTQAHSKLEMEEQARESHFLLLEHPLISDLLSPVSCIGEDELVATLLSESSDAVKIAMQIFAPEQQAQLCMLAHELIDSMDSSDNTVKQAKLRLNDMETMLQPINQTQN